MVREVLMKNHTRAWRNVYDKIDYEIQVAEDTLNHPYYQYFNKD